jgi:thymidine phosphorylase
LIAPKKPQSLQEWTSQIAAAVASGKLTPEEAEAKLQSKEPMSLGQWAERFEAMVAAGKLSAEDAEAKLAVLAAKVDSET